MSWRKFKPTSTRRLAGGNWTPTQADTHKNALADLDEVRQRLGYGQINLWGGSWGTRAALLYALTYPHAVRSVILDGAVALDLDFPRTVAGDAQRAFDWLIEACDRIQACGAAFPRMRPTVDALLAKFDRGPLDVTVRHPRTGAVVSMSLRREALIEIIRAALYTTADTPAAAGLGARRARRLLARDGAVGPLGLAHQRHHGGRRDHVDSVFGGLARNPGRGFRRRGRRNAVSRRLRRRVARSLRRLAGR